MPNFGVGSKLSLAALLVAALVPSSPSWADGPGMLERAVAPFNLTNARDAPPAPAFAPPSLATLAAPRESADRDRASSQGPPPPFAAPAAETESLPFQEPSLPAIGAAPAPATLHLSPMGSDVAARTPAEALAEEIHAALDRFIVENRARRPIGAGDWSAAVHAIANVYAARAYAPLWVEGDHFGDRARSALARLANAVDDGLDLAATPTPPIDWRDGAMTAQARADIALSAAIVAYAQEASGARISPRAISKDVTAKPEVIAPGAALRAVATAEDSGAALSGFNPPQEGYSALRAALANLRAPAASPVARFEPGPVLKLGMSDPRVPLIRAHFAIGSLSDRQTSQVYDMRVASAVAAFQRVHGLPANGALTEATAAALDGGGARNRRREQLILANMEMWRWEPRDMGAIRVEVNLADYSLKLIRNDAIVQRMRVIVGKPDTPTPVFSNSIKYMLLNPAWHVPESIIKKEMAPKYAADPTYFARHGYKISYVGDRLEVVQPPGEANALGRILFLFPNEHAVYLHDTPQRSLFSSDYRALSHGCVRVEEPARLAVSVMGGAARGWTEAKVRSLVGAKELTLALPVPVPIHLEYFTEFADERGTLHEREDLYGLTERVAYALAKLRRD